MWSVLTLAILHMLFFVASSKDWCSENCGDEKHLRCAFKQLSSNQRCPKIEVGFTPTERMNVLDAHNRWRDYVASGLGHINTTTNSSLLFTSKGLVPESSTPPHCSLNPGCKKNYYLWRDPEGQAADMRQLVWDYELEKNAAIWASQCSEINTRTHQCAFTDKFKVVHMNTDPTHWVAFASFSTFALFLNFISYPDNYFLGDRIKLVRAYQPGIWDPFYAAIYSQTYAVGCSRSICHCQQDLYPWGYSKVGSVTCLYGPSFDVTTSNFKIYEADKQHCSRCPKDTACNDDSVYKYLCARAEDPNATSPIPDDPNMFHREAPSLVTLCFALAVLLVAF